MSPRARALADGVLLQVGWFAAVLGAAGVGGVEGAAWWGPAAVVCAWACHLGFTPGAAAAWRGALVMLLVGLAHAHLQWALGVLRFGADGPQVGAVPLWLLMLWPLFAMTFGSSFASFRERPGRAALLGALGGPPGYFAAERLGALEIGVDWPLAWLSLAAGWALALACTLGRARDRTGRTTTASA